MILRRDATNLLKLQIIIDNKILCRYNIFVDTVCRYCATVKRILYQQKGVLLEIADTFSSGAPFALKGRSAMAESRIKDENYYQISGFMINRLGLKGVPLNVYAIIYGFSQDGESEFSGSLQYLCDFVGGVSKPTVINALKMLTEAGYILRREEHINNICFPRYRVNLPLLKNFNGGSKETSSEAVNNFNGGSKETLPNNKKDNKSFNNKKINISCEFERLWKLYPRKIGKPKALKAYEKARKNGVTFEEVEQGIKAYCRQIEAQQTNTEYIKHGSTWFNNEGWKDEYNFTPRKTYGANGVEIQQPADDDLAGIL